MFLQLGTFKFEGIKLPQSWTTTKETLYAQVPIIAGKAAVQRVGEKLQEIDLGIYLSSEFCNPKAELAALNDIRKRGVVSQLVDGTGRNYGKFVITSIQEDVVNALADGTISDISANMRLLEYNTIISLTIRKGKAYLSAKPVAVPPLQPLQAPTVGVLVSMNTANLTSQNIISNISKGQMTDGKLGQLQGRCDSATSGYNNTISKIRASAKLALRGAGTVISTINQVNGYITNIKIIAARLQAAQRQVNALPGAVLGADSLQDYADLATNGQQLSGSLYLLNVASAPFAAVVGSREGGI